MSTCTTCYFSLQPCSRACGSEHPRDGQTDGPRPVPAIPSTGGEVRGGGEGGGEGGGGEACLQSVMSPGGAMLCAVMPQVGPRWGCPHGCDTPGVNDPPPCAGYRIDHMGRTRRATHRVARRGSDSDRADTPAAARDEVVAAGASPCAGCPASCSMASTGAAAASSQERPGKLFTSSSSSRRAAFGGTRGVVTGREVVERQLGDRATRRHPAFGENRCIIIIIIGSVGHWRIIRNNTNDGI